MKSKQIIDLSRPVSIENRQPDKEVYVLRDDSMFCAHWNCEYEVRKIGEYIEEATGLQCVIINAQEQLDWAYKKVQEIRGTSTIISLDKWFKGDYDIVISRNFNEWDGLIGFIHGEVSTLIANQSTDILFVDDDVSSGRTFKYVSSLFPNCKSPHIFTLSDFINFRVFDIVDARDFIPGAIHGGLMIHGNRYLYTHPFVDLTKRMKFRDEIVSSTFKMKVQALWK